MTCTGPLVRHPSWNPGPSMPAIVYALAAVALAGLMVAFWAVFIERHMFCVRHVVLDSDSLGLPPLEVLHITDTHFCGHDAKALAFLERLAARGGFDLVLFTGDLIDSPAGVASAGAAASRFRARVGCFAVLGGHDYAQVDPVRAYVHILRNRPGQVFRGENPADELVRRLEAAGVSVLEDASVELTAPDGRRFALVALRDAFVSEPDYEAAWQGVGKDVPVIVMAHSPDVLPEVCARGAGLAFFGHTHGGQVRLPLLGALVTRCSLPRRLASGAFRQRDTVFIVNNGLGTSPIIPYRLLCPPEVTVAELLVPSDGTALTPIEDARLG